MSIAHLIFPHQLFKGVSPSPGETVYMIEEHLYFTQYRFHKQKLIFHRASMMAYAEHLTQSGFKVRYIEAISEFHDIRKLIPKLAGEGVTSLIFVNPTDTWLENRIRKSAAEHGLEITCSPSGLFINTEDEVTSIFGNAKGFFQTRFYIEQRKRRGILLDGPGIPAGGKWSFDDENRLKYPSKKTPPGVHARITRHHREAADYINKHFRDNPGTPDTVFPFPVTHKDADTWLSDFLNDRFSEFGVYEDAIVKSEPFLHHGVLTPMLNTGLLDPMDVLNKAIAHARTRQIPLNSLEGFVRQILGWREFVRGVYQSAGTRQRTTNFWGFSRKIPSSFYTGTTGIDPVDQTIIKLLDNGYNHHIERLMVLSNFMLLCEFDPDEVYRWFMEMYIDSYDWVMVPNVYGMGQFADGGLLSTKPYISGSNYICKMSDYPKGDPWTKTWDALFWRFIHVHRDFFTRNPRLGMMVRTFDKMDTDKRNELLLHADQYLNKL